MEKFKRQMCGKKKKKVKDEEIKKTKNKQT
jgi:hypothetical protein